MNEIKDDKYKLRGDDNSRKISLGLYGRLGFEVLYSHESDFFQTVEFQYFNRFCHLAFIWVPLTLLKVKVTISTDSPYISLIVFQV